MATNINLPHKCRRVHSVENGRYHPPLLDSSQPPQKNPSMLADECGAGSISSFHMLSTGVNNNQREALPRRWFFHQKPRPIRLCHCCVPRTLSLTILMVLGGVSCRFSSAAHNSVTGGSQRISGRPTSNVVILKTNHLYLG